MEQHLATEHDGELDGKSSAAEQAPAENTTVPVETTQNPAAAPADAEPSHEADTASQELLPLPEEIEAEGVTPAVEAQSAPSEAVTAVPVESIEPTTADLPEPKESTSAPSDEQAESPVAAAESTNAVATEPAPVPVNAVSADQETAHPVLPPVDQKPVEPPPAAPVPNAAAFLEQWQKNEPMRHIPAIAWIVSKVDGDVRKRLEMFVSVYENVPAADPRHRPAEESLFAVCRSLDKLAESARRTRSVLHPPNELAFRIPWSVNTAVTVLKNTDATTFGRRQPFQSFDRSPAEVVYAALLVVLQRIDAAATLLRELDPTLDEKLYGPLVQLNEPMPTAPMA